MAVLLFHQDPEAVVNNLFVAFVTSFASYYPDIETVIPCGMG